MHKFGRIWSWTHLRLKSMKDVQSWRCVLFENFHWLFTTTPTPGRWRSKNMPSARFISKTTITKCFVWKRERDRKINIKKNRIKAFWIETHVNHCGCIVFFIHKVYRRMQSRFWRCFLPLAWYSSSSIYLYLSNIYCSQYNDNANAYVYTDSKLS